MKLSTYARHVGISYRTAVQWYKSGQRAGYQMPTGTILITKKQPEEKAAASSPVSAIIYARVSSAENKTNLDSQAQRLVEYCTAKGYQITGVVKEVGSGVNDTRPKLSKLLTLPDAQLIAVEHKDRLTRFGFNYIEQLLRKQNRCVEVVNLVDNGKEDLIQDFVSIITSICARIYGQRRAKRRTEQIIAQLENQEEA